MLAVPIHKIGHDQSDVATALQIYFRSLGGGELTSDIEDDIQMYSTLRERVVAIEEPSPSNLNDLLQFHHLMRNVAPRLDDYTTAGSAIGKSYVSCPLELKFSWTDAFKPASRATWKSFYFDWANVLWNYGAVASRFAAMQNRLSEEGLRDANKHFQLAAGIYDYIQSFLLPKFSSHTGLPGNTGTLPCLSNDCLTFVKTLNLAQAQQCFYEKAVNDKKNGSMKSAIIAKLAIQTSQLYTTAATACKVGVIGSVLDATWCNHMDYQSKVCQAAAEYWQSQTAKETALQQGRGFGEEVARLQQAESLLHQALAMAVKFKLSPQLVDMANALMSTIVSKKKEAENDLRVVYLESVPAFGSLAAIVGVIMVKPLPIAELADLDSRRQLFKAILPCKVKELNDKLVERVQAIHMRSATDSMNATNEGRVMLSSVGLPGSLEAFKSGGDIPDSLWEKVVKVQSLNGTNQIRTKLEEIYSSSQQAKSSLAAVETSLNREEATDRAFRMKYSQYSGVPSSVPQQEIRENFAKFKSVFLQAQVSDDAIVRDIAGEPIDMGVADSPLFAIISSAIPARKLGDYGLLLSSSSKHTLLQSAKLLNNSSSNASFSTARMLAPNTVADLLDFGSQDDLHQVSTAIMPNINAATTDVIRQLESSLIKMAVLIDSREKFTLELATMVTNAVENGEYSNKLLNISKSSSHDATLQSFVDEVISQAESLKDKIAESIVQQETMLSAEILPYNERFVQLIEKDPVSIERNKIISKVESVVAAFYTWHSQLSAGITFYSNLQTRLSSLLQNSDDLAYTQQLLRQDFEAGYMRNFQQLDQEARDRDLAMKLSAEMNISTNSAPIPPPATVAPYSEYSIPQHPADNVYGVSPTIFQIPPPHQGYSQPPQSYSQLQQPPPAYNLQQQQQQQQQQYHHHQQQHDHHQQQGYAHLQPQPQSPPQPQYNMMQPQQQQCDPYYSGQGLPTPPPLKPPRDHSLQYQPATPQSAVIYSTGYPGSAGVQPQYTQLNAPSAPGPAPSGGSNNHLQYASLSPTLNANNNYGNGYSPAAFNAPSPNPPFSQQMQQPVQQPSYNYYGEPHFQPQQPYSQQNSGLAMNSPPPQATMQSNGGAFSGDQAIKIQRLCDMGFPRATVEQFLVSYNFNEEAALNAILTAESLPTSGQPAAGATPAPASSARNSGGLFGKVWGRKS